MATTLPIKKRSQINTISKLLRDHPRNHALFILGLNTALRGIDLLSLTVGQVRNLEASDSMSIREQKTGKWRDVYLNQTVVKAIQRLIKSLETDLKKYNRTLSDDEPLFQNKQRKVLCRDTFTRLVSKWCADIGLKRKPGLSTYGAHTLRKTLGYHMYRNGARIEELQSIYNHSSPGQTLTYICITSSEVAALHDSVQLG